MPRADNMVRFHAWPSGNAVALNIEFDDNVQMTMVLDLAEIEDLLRVIDQVLGPSDNDEGPIALHDH